MLQLKAIRDKYAALEARLVKARQAPRDEVTVFKETAIDVQLTELSTNLQVLVSGLQHGHEVCIM